MGKEILLSNQFKWIPIDQRRDRFGTSLPHRKPELRKPLLWICPLDDDLFLVNLSGGPLDSVQIILGANVFSGDNIYQTKVPSEPNYSYQNVAEGDAVKIDDFNEPYDSSFMCYIWISIESKHLGPLELEASPTRRGRPLETVLLWDTLEKGEKFYHVQTITGKFPDTFRKL
jgi:hypothetical protein